MTVPIASGIAFLLALYTVVGIGTAAFAHAKGIDAKDSDVRSGSIGFRLLITPGLVALWPVVLRAMLRDGGMGPASYSAPHDGPGHRLPHRRHRAAILTMIVAILAILTLGWL
jgi:hypothetical protein